MAKKKYSRVYVEISNICNMSCSFCPGTKRPLKRMNMEEFQHVTTSLLPLTDYVYFHVMGEPLTHPLICDFIKAAKEAGLKSVMTTNGTLLGRKGREIVDAGIYKVNISIHSFEEGTDEAYMSYINECLDFADYASGKGVIVCLRLWNRGFDEGRNIDTEAIIRERFADCEWHEGSRGYRIRNKLHLEFDDRFQWPDMSAEDCGNKIFCYGLKDHFGVLCDGTVIPCCLDHEGDIALGNIFEDDINHILGGKRAVAMRNGFMNRQATEELCRKCGYARKFG